MVGKVRIRGVFVPHVRLRFAVEEGDRVEGIIYENELLIDIF